MASANRVGEIFSAAGVAFSKLGELTMHLHGNQEASAPNGHKWDDEDIEMLRSAVKKFGEELNKVSETIKHKTNAQVKAGIKRKAFEDAGVTGRATPASPLKKVSASGLLTSGSNVVAVKAVPVGSQSKVITKPVQMTALNAFNSESENDSVDV